MDVKVQVSTYLLMYCRVLVQVKLWVVHVLYCTAQYSNLR